MLKVIHILNTGSFSGAEKVAINIINSTKNNFKSYYVSPNGSISKYLKENDIEFIPVRKVNVFEIRRILKTVKPDIIHAHDFNAGIISVCSGTRCPIISHIHNNSPWIKHINIKSIIYAFSCLRYKIILTVSDSVMKEYIFGRMFKHKTRVVGNPIDINEIQELAGDIDNKIYDIAFLGRISTAKNPFLFIDIIKSLKKTIPNISAIMIGDGELKSEIVKKIENDNLSKNISMVGFKKNPYVYLNKARILLMPSTWEGYGLAAVEALSLGLPVICSNAGGLTSIVDNECGKICYNKDDYEQIIIKLLFDENLLKKYSNAAIQKAKQHDNTLKYMKTINKIYRSVI